MATTSHSPSIHTYPTQLSIHRLVLTVAVCFLCLRAAAELSRLIGSGQRLEPRSAWSARKKHLTGT